MDTSLDSPTDERDVIECDEWQSLFVADKEARDERTESARWALPELVDDDRMQTVQILLGRATLDGAGLQPQQVIRLDRSASDPLELRCEGRLMARGEVVVVRGKLCLRVIETFPN